MVTFTREQGEIVINYFAKKETKVEHRLMNPNQGNSTVVHI